MSCITISHQTSKTPSYHVITPSYHMINLVLIANRIRLYQLEFEDPGSSASPGQMLDLRTQDLQVRFS